MRTFFTGILPISILLLSAGASPAMRGQTTVINTSISSKTSFRAPTVVQAPTIANDSPGQSWNYPADPTAVMQKVYKWLNHATVTAVQIPKQNRNLVFMDYIGPSQLYFTDQHAHSIRVEPAYYIAHGNQGYRVALIKDVIEYKDGNHTDYLKSTELSDWLGNDKNWESDFRVEYWTDAEKAAIHDAKASPWGGHFTTMFPAIPGVNPYKILPGGPAPALGKTTASMPGTVASLVDAEGENFKVTFLEVWNNGTGQHRWTYVVNPKGTVLAHGQSGDIPPQDWK